MALASEKAIDDLSSPLDLFHAISVLRVRIGSNCVVGHRSCPFVGVGVLTTNTKAPLEAVKLHLRLGSGRTKMVWDRRLG